MTSRDTSAEHRGLEGMDSIGANPDHSEIHCTPLGWLDSKSEITSVGEDAEKLEPLHAAVGL